MHFESNWLVHIPDKPSTTVQQIRTKNVPAHLSHNKMHLQAGSIVMMGPIVESHPTSPGEAFIPNGSIQVWKADSEAEVREKLSEDPYAVLGVWDLEQATVTPFLSTVRKTL